MTSVFRHQEDIITVADDWIARLKVEAREEPLKRARLNLHQNDSDPLHEMLIALCAGTLIPPHRHFDKTESIHVIDGELLVVTFDDAGEVTKKMYLKPPGSGGPFMYRMAVPVWHAVIPISDVVVVHETTMGPFVKSSEPPPAWVPKDAAAIERFLENLK